MTTSEKHDIDMERAFARIMLTIMDMADEAGMDQVELTAFMAREVAQRISRIESRMSK